VNESTTGGVINRIYPEAVLCGGITGFDKDMIEKDRKGEAEGGWAGAQGGAKYSAGEGVSRITLDLSIMDYKTQVFFPQVLASNAILVRKDKFGWGVRAYYMGCGGSFESEVKQKQGVHAGLRLLVELSVLEVLGKYFCVPYWKCIKDGKRDTLMIERLSAQINEMPENQRLIHLKKLLFVHGYRGIDKSRAETDSAELGVISAAMNEKKCSTTAELFMVLWENVPVDAAVARVLKERKFQAEEGRRAAREAAAQAKAQAKAQAEEAARQAAERKQLEEQFIAVTEGGDKLFNAKNYKQALAEYKKAAALNIGQELIQQRIQAAENALAQIQAAENLYRQNLAGGAALLKSGDNAKAAAAYEAALKVRPGDSAAAAGLEAAKKKIKEKNPVGVNKLNEKDWNDDSQ
jgi:hypothetical protein